MDMGVDEVVLEFFHESGVLYLFFRIKIGGLRGFYLEFGPLVFV